jgi:hypothetical protein
MMKQENLKLPDFTLRRVLSHLVLIVLMVPGVSGQNKNAAKFTSFYTDTTKNCKGEEPVFTCKGYGGYKVVIGIGGVFSDARVEADKSDYSLLIAERQSVGWNPKIEWRMADGKPFAVILRVDINDENADIPKKIGEQLIIKGLKGFESIDEAVNGKTPKANEKAREIADQGFNKGGAIQADETLTNGKTEKEPDLFGHFSIKGKAPQGFADIYQYIQDIDREAMSESNDN